MQTRQTALPEALPGRLGAAWRNQLLASFLAIAIFSVLSAWAGIKSKGFLEADGCVHYEYARFAVSEHHLFTNVWGRPFCTAIYCLPAYFGGLHGVRIASLVIALAIGLITYRIAQNQGLRSPALALIFLLGQPMVFLHSFSELTELPFALLLALGFRAYQARAWLWLAIVASILPTARPEGFGFLIMTAVALLLHRRCRYLPILVVPLLLWSVAGWYFDLCPQPWWRKIPQWLPQNWPYSSESVYGRGFILRFVVLLPAILSPLVFPAVLIGIWRSFSFRKQTDLVLDASWDAITGDDHRLRVQWLIALIPLTILATHSLLYWAGRMASSGELRYMTAAAPMWALLAASGWEWLFSRMTWRAPLTCAGLAVLLPLMSNLAYTVVPLKMDPDWQRGEEAVRWLQSSKYRQSHPKVIAPHPAVKYYQGVSPTDPAITPEWSRYTVQSPPPGAVLVWDPNYTRWNSDASRVVCLEDVQKAGWICVKTFQVVNSQPGRPGKLAILMYHVKKPILSLFGKHVAEPGQQQPREILGEWYIFASPLDLNGKPTPRDPQTRPASQ